MDEDSHLPGEDENGYLPEDRVVEFQHRFASNIPQELRDIFALFPGKAWLIGSTIPLVIEGRPHDRDYDFLVEEIPDIPGWTARPNMYGNPKFCKGDLEIDVVPITNIYHIKRRGAGIPGGMAPTIENYLTGTPLAHQSIVYDVQRKELVGGIGMLSMHNRLVYPNDPIQLSYYCYKKNKRPNALIREHAERLGYTPVEVAENFIDVFLPPSASHPDP